MIFFPRKNVSQFSFCLNQHYITAQPPPSSTQTPHNHLQTFTKHYSTKNVDDYEKGRTNNSIVLDKVETTGKSKLSYNE